MTEIPEHLLKRSQAAKAKASGGDAPAEAAASVPATTQAAAPAAVPAAARPAKNAPTAPPPPKPDPPYVAAAKRRKKIPFWAFATLSILPIWVFMYVRALTPTPVVIAGPLGDGATIYSGCATCHAPDGSGGIGYPFIAGSVLKTFPHIEDQLAFVYNGTDKYALAGIGVYGNPDREGGVHATGARGKMPGQGAILTEAQILAVVCHERFDLAGEESVGEEYDKWCSPESEAYAGLEDGSLTFDNIADKLDGTLVIGTAPRPATPADG